jgi:hypothetical protein
MKIVGIVMLLLLSHNLFADALPGDVNFSLDPSTDNHAYKFRLIVDDTAITFPTSCITPKDGLAQALAYGAIGRSTAKLTLQASDCANAQDHWFSLNGVLDYDSNYWYDVYINMSERSFHM